MTAAEDLPFPDEDDDGQGEASPDLAPAEPADSEPEPEPAPKPRKKAPHKKKKRPKGGLAGQRPLVRPPITVGRHLSDGRSYGWVKTYQTIIPDEGTLFRDLGPGRFRLQCPANGLQYVEIHPSAASRPTSPQPQHTDAPEPAELDGPPSRAPVVLLARILSVANQALDQARANNRAIEALATRPTGRQYPPPQAPPPNPLYAPQYGAPGQPPPQYAPPGAPPPPVWNPYTGQWQGYTDAAELDDGGGDSTLDKLREFAELKYLVDEVAGMFGPGGAAAGDEDDDGNWMRQGAEMLFKRMAGAAPPPQAPPYAYQPGAPPAGPPVGWTPPPQAAPAPAPQQPAQTPAQPPAPAPVTLPGMTEEIAGELAAMAPALGMDWPSMLALATSYGWTAPQALEMARQRVAGG